MNLHHHQMSPTHDPETASATNATPTNRLLYQYRSMRGQAKAARGFANHPPDVLALIRAEAGEHLSRQLATADAAYATPDAPYSRQRVETNLLGMCEWLSVNFPEYVAPVELEATEKLINMTFDCYENGIGAVEDGYAFVVSMRASADTAEYRHEVPPIVPVAHYIPGPLRALMLQGLPPYVLDTYTIKDGLPGYLVCCPVYGDEAGSMRRNAFIRSARADVQRTIDFATNKLKAKFIGLGGILPSITRYGQTLDAPDAVITTGHAGTIALVLAKVEQGLERHGEPATIGVLGLGSIGRAIASAITTRFARPGVSIIIHDADSGTSRRVLESLPEATKVRATDSTAELVTQADIVVSAITSKVGEESLFPTQPGPPVAGAVIAQPPLAGKLFIDDSQPFAFPPGLVEGLGGQVTWVIARMDQQIRRSWYDYASMASAPYDFFGCEAEVSVLAAEYSARIADGANADDAFDQVRRYAVGDAATIEQVEAIEELFRRHGVMVAPDQTFASGEWHGESNSTVDLRSSPMLDLTDPGVHEPL